MTSIALQGITKTFGSTTAVDHIDLTINAGDLFFLLGPSGCGKTTLLRMIAGFIPPTSGAIRFGQQNVTMLPPNKRNAGMVFQSYALWPHMTVADNVAYGLKVRKIAASERNDRVHEALASVQMAPYAHRKPNELSGGQQQRVALARALVIKPTVLLLDEPLSNLDAKLRLEMRIEIRRICKSANITTVYVTHDQKEALSMADNVAVLRAGRTVQVGPPRKLYDRPASRFVADFLGETNFISAVVTGAENNSVILETPAGILRSSAGFEYTPTVGNVTCSIRPEAVRVIDAPPSRNTAPQNGSSAANLLTGKRVQSIYLGEIAQHIVELADDSHLKVLELNPSHFGEPGDSMHLAIDPSDVVILTD